MTEVVEFREYTGRDVHGVEHVQPRWRIFVAGRFVGYMHKRPGCSPCIVQPVSDAEKSMIEVAANQQHGERPAATVAPYIPHGDLPGDDD